MPIKADNPSASARQQRHMPVSPARGSALVIGLINNMPDAALQATESQFSSVLAAAAGDRDVRLRLSYLPEVKRGPEAQRYLEESYWRLSTLQEDPPDALIVTGAEPLAAALSEEPYWRRFIELVEWADRHTVSSIWSCLAAHAAVQHLSGIARRRLPEKCCGVFDHELLAGHPLNAGLDAPLPTPQSRWNDLPVKQLREAGYAIASESAATGANIFSKQCRSLMLFFQGHPEYESCTLLREYRRDIVRFLAGTNPQYPTLPQGYFSESAHTRLAEYRDSAITHRSPQWISRFPFEVESRELRHTWKAAATILYANWLSLIEQALSVTAKPVLQQDGIVR
jgi:homoserine O-succinyltransferase/O-acetyltransferase